MHKVSIAAACGTSIMLLLAGCSAQSAQGHVSMQNGQYRNFGQRRAMTPEEMQKDIDEANAASDKTSITKDAFVAQLQTLIQAQREKFQQQNGDQQSSFQGGQFSRGSGSGQFGANGMSDRLATAVQFFQYTDKNNQISLLALDADGKVVMKWPRAFPMGGMRGGSGSMMQQSSSQS
jgi:hypothetical protein